MYNQLNQYRCTIIRGKSQKDIDNFLPAYAKIISEVCPCKKSDFEREFNDRMRPLIPGNATKKTLDNHRTEVAGKLFGMYYTTKSAYDDEMYVYPSARTLKFLEDNDQPAFFKDVCFKMQFPNGMTKPDTVKERIDLGISIRQCCYVIEVLREAESRSLFLSKNDIGYYVLNSLDALQRLASPYEIVDAIQRDRVAGVLSHFIGDPAKESSYNLQHINEQINYMELANLVVISDDGIVRLNSKEQTAIDIFASHWDDQPLFDVTAFDFSTPNAKQYFQFAWDEYYSALSDEADNFRTSIAALIDQESEGETANVVTPTASTGGDTVELGDEGEEYVYNYEKRRVTAFNARLANKVLALGKTRGLGYDIQTVIAEPGDQAEFVKYIEVKATKRVTAPDVNDPLWVDTINVTRNEWIAAQQHGAFYAIYRVYFVRGGVVMYVLENPYELCQNGRITVAPTMYRVDFGSSAVQRVIQS